ncbi:hypothetical protein [Acidovorax sp. FG27]|uniref:hypothetical protein n=1 Tax=Acidovorax sp. FG27 TaxID=3133652 RepID=UPI0030E860A8
MSDACYCDYDPAEFYSVSVPTARKAHRCDECGRAISPGETYERVIGKWDGSVSVFKTCRRCTALRDHLKAHVPCFCWAHGNLLGDACEEWSNGLSTDAAGSGLMFELGRMAVAIKRAPAFRRPA